MAEPASWGALELVRNRLLGITAVAGYRTNLGAGSVTLDPSERRSVGSGMHTLVSARTIDSIGSRSTTRIDASEMPFDVEIIVPFAAEENPALVAHRARADVVRALRSGGWDSAEGIRSISVTGSSFDIGTDGEAVVVATISARAELAEFINPAT